MLRFGLTSGRRWPAGTIAGLLLAGLLLLVSHTARAADDPAGRYRLTGEHDVASELTLRPDGEYEYFLIAGALDEHSRGHWRVEGKTLRLTTEPKPVAPVFSAGAVAADAEAAMVVHVVSPGGRGIAGVDVRVGFDTGEPIEGYTQEYGWRLPDGETRAPRWIEFAVPMHQLRSPRFTIDPTRGNDLTFVLTPNDIGLIEFDDIAITIESGRLIMRRRDALLRYEAMTPSPQDH